NPTATTSRPLTLKRYCFPLSNVRVPLPHDHPTPRAADVAVPLRGAEGLAGAWAMGLLRKTPHTKPPTKKHTRVADRRIILGSFLNGGVSCYRLPDVPGDSCLMPS